MNCKKCKAELPKGVTVCPECGADNSPPANAITMTPGKLVLVIVTVVLLTAVVVGLILQGMGCSFSQLQSTDEEMTQAVQESAAPTEIPTEAPPATIPADGNPDDATCKGSYTVSDEEAIANRDQVVATAGDAVLTNGELQIYYWLQVQNFLSNYGSYAMYFGLDYTAPLDTQSCTISETAMTWQQYFLDCALADWHNYQALANESQANGFELDQTYRTLIEELPTELAVEGGLQGFANAEEYLAYNVGAGASLENYQKYMEVYYRGYLYFESVYDSLVPTDDELEAYFAGNEASYAEKGVTKDGLYVDVRHILVLPEGATVETIYTQTFSDEAWAAGETNAQAILDEWLAGEISEETFAEFANIYSADPGSNTNGGLYEDVYVGQMVAEFEAWCFDESRQVGDYGIVRTDLGFHIMYFSGSTPIWREYAMSDILGERGSALIAQVNEKYPMEVDYSAITLGCVDMAS